MQIEIIKVEQKDCIEVTTNEDMPLYRRHEPNVWYHFLGENFGWQEYRFTEFLEEAYQIWLRITLLR